MDQASRVHSPKGLKESNIEIQEGSAGFVSSEIQVESQPVRRQGA